jgi:hypothetical protein
MEAVHHHLHRAEGEGTAALHLEVAMVLEGVLAIEVLERQIRLSQSVQALKAFKVNSNLPSDRPLRHR